jgi:hypothetical protein
MSPSQWLELRHLAAKYSPEILRAVPYMTDDEAYGNLAFLRRIDDEQRSAPE